jgi:sterol desaturase/sphingolipid hydroxylase (fatty acid hydroxylase superfamily)
MTPEQTLPRQAGKEHPYRIYKREQEVISRHKIYRTTAFYSSYTIILLALAIRSGHFLRALEFVPFGIMLWMATEYFSHRFILHRHWKVSQRKYKRFWTRLANKYFDPLHFGHHEKPFDGDHMSGRVRDLLPLFFTVVPLSILLFPPFTASIIVAFAFQSYIAEEWIHHATHFSNFRDPYFRYMKKHHLYHHTSQGMTRGFGTSSGVLDFIFKTRFPQNVRQRLYGGKKVYATNQSEQQIKQTQPSLR